MNEDEFEFWQMDRKPGDELEADIFKAMEVFEKKSGQKANLVLINPADLAGKTIDAVGFEVQAMKDVLVGTLWVGRKEIDS